jgi:hypothetical protein
MVQDRSRAFNCCGHAERAERPQPVCLHRDPGAGGVPSRVAFDKIDLAASTVEGGSQSEPGNSAADNQNCLDTGHLSCSSESDHEAHSAIALQELARRLVLGFFAGALFGKTSRNPATQCEFFAF